MRKGKDGLYNRYIKRILGFSISFVTLIILSPLFLVLIIVGTIAMKGNPFFVQERPGVIDPKKGREKIFRLIKFRTMTNAVDENGKLLPSKERLTKYGRFLRKTSLDELGQLFNILSGDMAIVGPRPLLVKYLPLYSEDQHHRHDLLPGITGYAQVMGRNSLSWEEKFDLDLEYVNSVSFILDLKIIKKTIFAVLKRENIDGSNGTIVEEFTGTNKEETIV